MTKFKIVLLSILILLIALAAVLFGAVFRVREQNIVAVGEDVEYCNNLKDEILNAGNIKNGSSIFMLDKQSAINNIEKTYPYVKVVQIKTTGVTSIEIKVRKRYEMFYATANGKFYVLDEDLKVLRITDLLPNAILFNVTKLSITNNTKEGDFVGSDYYRSVANDLVAGLYSNALLDRAEMIDAIAEISFNKGVTLHEEYNRLVLLTQTGVEMDICKPEDNLAQKINICFSIYQDDDFTEQQQSEGRIKIYLDENGNQKVGYFQP